MWPGVPTNEVTALQSEIFLKKAAGLMKNIDADKVRCGSCMPWLQNSYFRYWGEKKRALSPPALI